MYNIQIGEYIFDKTDINKLGKGGFSEVYGGIYVGYSKDNINKGDKVAIKILTKEKNKQKYVDNEINIINILRKNPHYNIVNFYDIIKKDDTVYIIMEYCDSHDLIHYTGNPIMEQYVQFYFCQLANGLKHLNKLNIYHRDIKPRNLLLTENKKILKIADFGLAKINEDVNYQTQSNSLFDTICGSPMHMAPEIRKDRLYGFKTDLWSIGIILYELLYGFHPFGNCKTIEQLQNMVETTIIKIPPEPSLNKNKNVSSECLLLLKGLLQTNAYNRLTWNDFFSHEWITKYDDILSEKNNDIVNNSNIDESSDWTNGETTKLNYNVSDKITEMIFDMEI